MATGSDHGGGTQEHPPAPPSGALAEAVGATIGMTAGGVGGAWLVSCAWARGPWLGVLSAALALVGFVALMIAGSVCGRVIADHVRAARRR
jgi:hypothetical protein